MNKDTKTKGGIIGVTQDYNAVEKLTLTAHLRASVYNNFPDLCEVSQHEQENALAKETNKASENIIVKSFNAIS